MEAQPGVITATMTLSKSIFTLDGSLCCDSNMVQLTNNLTELDGVDEARGSFAANKVTVTYHGDTVTEDDIVGEIGNAGVSVEDTATFDIPDV